MLFSYEIYEHQSSLSDFDGKQPEAINDRSTKVGNNSIMILIEHQPGYYQIFAITSKY